MRALRLTILLICLIALTVTASAQGVRTASPPIVTVQLNGYEPPPPGVPLDVFYGGLGGGGGEPFYLPPAPMWDYTPGALASGENAYFSACGYRSATPPGALLTYPSGAVFAVALDPYLNEEKQCFDYWMTFTYGMELGLYTLTLNHPDGDLSHTFGYEYPLCWKAFRTGDLEWVTGVESSQQMSVYFYSFLPDSSGNTFIAQRDVRADNDGVLAMDVQVARTAPFTRDEVFFAPTGVGRALIDASPNVGAYQFADMGFSVPTPPSPSTYPQNGFSLSTYSRTDPRGISCDGEYGQFAQVYVFPSGNGTVPLVQSVNSSSASGELRGGEPVEILEYVPAINDGRVYAWKRVRAANGVTGWTRALDFLELYTDGAPGARARLNNRYQRQGNAHYPIPQPVYDSSGALLGEFSAGTEVTLVERTDDNWRIRLDDGREGVIAEYDPETFLPSFVTLPWSPDGSVENSGSSSGSGGTVSCPGSPTTRLQPGMRARVTPGDPNNIRAQPESGRVLGEIPAGGVFSVLAGPQCGDGNGLTWWEVEYEGVRGWTAEGRGGEYWLEPAGEG